MAFSFFNTHTHKRDMKKNTESSYNNGIYSLTHVMEFGKI